MGAGVGVVVGTGVGTVVGKAVGAAVGEAVGAAVGTVVGEAVGVEVGSVVGAAVGPAVGAGDGDAEGAALNVSLSNNPSKRRASAIELAKAGAGPIPSNSRPTSDAIKGGRRQTYRGPMPGAVRR